MYQPKAHKRNDKQFIFNFIKHHPFAVFIISGYDLLATHIPLLIEGNQENFRFYGHIANHNEMLHFLQNGKEVLCVFHGPHTYVSSSIYTEPDISTWDYSAVHVNAKITLQNDEELAESLERLIYTFEKEQEQPLYKEQIPKEIWNQDFPNITGFWLEPFRIQGIHKWHGNFEKEERQHIAQKLSEKNLCPKFSTKEIITNFYDSQD